jgi:hypothetical protein
MTDFMLREQKNPTFYRGLWRARGEQKRQKICVFLAVSTAAVRARGLSALTRQRIDAVIFEVATKGTHWTLFRFWLL